MAKVQIITAITLDGFLPGEGEELFKWVKTAKQGFLFWHERSTFMLPVGYPMLDLICEKDKKNSSCIYTAEISDEKGLELLHGLSIYHLIDEIIVYILPLTYGKGIVVLKQLPLVHWQLHKSVMSRNGICRLIYHKSSR
ncbi:hypothetical protein [uncultured Duncaniella sp.]|uniref:hypothetical protein n=1 Tax=uncultured Duncaniella sp. TaxID=2768039 RepID=UPI0025B15C52|nr:hypothetical protein [uncultured Duncaniella sp.]